MPINLIDIATVVPRSQETNINQNNEIRHNVHAREEVAKNFSNEIKHNSQQTVETEKEQWADYLRDESKGRAGGRQQGQKKRKEKENEKEQSKAPISNSVFDIKI